MEQLYKWVNYPEHKPDNDNWVMAWIEYSKVPIITFYKEPFGWGGKNLSVYKWLEPVESNVPDKWLKFMEEEKTALGMSDHKTIDRLIWYYKTYFQLPNQGEDVGQPC